MTVAMWIGLFTLVVVPILQAINNAPKISNPSRFKVMEKYKSCDVVRYTPPQSAKFSYFLDCSTDK